MATAVFFFFFNTQFRSSFCFVLFHVFNYSFHIYGILTIVSNDPSPHQHTKTKVTIHVCADEWKIKFKSNEASLKQPFFFFFSFFLIWGTKSRTWKAVNKFEYKNKDTDVTPGEPHMGDIIFSVICKLKQVKACHIFETSKEYRRIAIKTQKRVQVYWVLRYTKCCQELYDMGWLSSFNTGENSMKVQLESLES